MSTSGESDRAELLLANCLFKEEEMANKCGGEGRRSFLGEEESLPLPPEKISEEKFDAIFWVGRGQKKRMGRMRQVSGKATVFSQRALQPTLEDRQTRWAS